MKCVSVCVQFRLVMRYLSEMTEEQTLVMYSGHPMGLFPSLPSSPRAIITNGMVSAQCHTRSHLQSSCVLTYSCLHHSGHSQLLIQGTVWKDVCARCVNVSLSVTVTSILGYLTCTNVIFVVILTASRYGQMTAGSYCYIGPQGIVHGTMVSK